MRFLLQSWSKFQKMHFNDILGKRNLTHLFPMNFVILLKRTKLSCQLCKMHRLKAIICWCWKLFCLHVLNTESLRKHSGGFFLNIPRISWYSLTQLSAKTVGLACLVQITIIFVAQKNALKTCFWTVIHVVVLSRKDLLVFREMYNFKYLSIKTLYPYYNHMHNSLFLWKECLFSFHIWLYKRWVNKYS